MGSPRLLLILALLAAATAPLHGDEPSRKEAPLHERIDALIEQRLRLKNIEAQPLSGDAEFARRIYLDLAGRIPTAAETRAFLADEAPQKRAKLIDRLLDGPEYPQKMAETFHIMLMERRGDDEQWGKFLEQAFAENLSWDRIAASIIHPEVEDETRRGAAYFMTARLVSEGAMAPVDVPGLTRDVGRLLAGVDLQCAQCHDHLDIEDYKQRDFQGLHMIFENVQTRRDTDFPAVAEKLMTDEKEYMSVFIQQPETTGPVVPGGEEIEIVTFEEDDAYRVPPDRKKRQPGVPRFSPLEALAQGLTSKENELFARNFVNRLWFLMMGRGLVEPLDLHHSDNPPSHPELLKLLASEFAARDFDIKWLVRELALTETYQRTSRLADGETAPPQELFATALERRISAEQLLRSVLVATGELERQTDGAVRWGEAAPEAIDELIAKSDDLQKLQERFIDTFANPPKEPELEFAPTVEAALFLMHEKRVLRLLELRGGNLVDRLSKMEDEDEAAMIDELFLTILSRPPSDEDRADVVRFLRSREDRPQAIGDVAWALLASTEFCVNH